MHDIYGLYSWFRVSELLGLKLSDAGGQLIRQWLAQRQKYKNSEQNDWLFLSRTGVRMSRQQFYKIIRQTSLQANLAVCANPHMLRHSCGYALADNGVDTRLIQDYLGHRNIRHTVRYTASNAGRFGTIWQERGKRKLSTISTKLLTEDD